MWVLQRGYSGDGYALASTLCRYDLRKGDLFVLCLATSEAGKYLYGAANVCRIFLLSLVARCIETIDVCIWSMFICVSIVVTVWRSVGMYIVYRLLMKIVGF